MSAGTWILQRCPGDRFPYRLIIENTRGEILLQLRAQDRWPAANQNIFCLREDPANAPATDPEVERTQIVALQRRGMRTSVVLDRARYKRCDFLFLKRSYKGRPDETYEQIFWQTQTSMTQRRPKIAAPAALRGKATMTIAIDSRERYPWRFPGSTVDRQRLDSGDYALIAGEEVVARVERKTFENLLADFGVMPLLHQRLLELSSHPNNALVIEAPYEDFLNKARLHHYSPSYCAAVIADLYARFPMLRITFCGNRKAANAWTASYFAAVWENVQAGNSEERLPGQGAPQQEPATGRRVPPRSSRGGASAGLAASELPLRWAPLASR